MISQSRRILRSSRERFDYDSALARIEPHGLSNIDSRRQLEQQSGRARIMLTVLQGHVPDPMRVGLRRSLRDVERLDGVVHGGADGTHIPGRSWQVPPRQVPQSQSLLIAHFLMTQPVPDAFATHCQLTGQIAAPGCEQWIAAQPCGSFTALASALQVVPLGQV